MDYENKYKNALEKAKAFELPEYKNIMASIFPELVESDDEMIEKKIINFIKQKGHVPYRLTDNECDEMLAWLEKQGEQEQLYIRFGEIPTDEKSKIYRGEIEVGTENGVSVYPAFKTSEGDIVLGLTLPITKTTLYTQQHLLEYDDRPCYLVKGDYVGKDTDGQSLINNVSIIEKIDTYRVKEKKQDEQKFEMKSPEESLGISSEEYNDIVNECLYGESNSSDKIEPKFHEGDWVVNKLGNSWHIDSFDKKNYQVSDIKGNYNYFPISIQDRMRLWAIQDAKDGDILVYNNGVVEIILLFKEWKNGYIGSADAYVHMYNNKIIINNWCDCSYTAHPATKEQCDILFQKMKEEGYEWNNENKELKKIKQNPVDNIKSKFKIGDWIVSSVLGTAHIIGVNDSNKYQLEYIDGRQEFSNIDYVNYAYDKWTIQDAKDGDVLSWDDSKCIALFKNIYDEDSFNSYGLVGHCTGTFEPRQSYHDIEGAHPATIEQYDLLVQKMKEAGYEWNSETKELKKIKQKSVDKVEPPKFKDGDWIVFNERTLYIRQVINGFYRTISKSGLTNIYDWDIDNVSRLWTINDAKDGDILFQDLMDGKTFIYNGINPDTAILYSFIISNDGKDVLPYHIGKPNTGIGNIEENKNIIHPATKEQCDILFKKMHEAGYTFDFEKKELNKIHVIDEGKAEMDYCFTKMMNGKKVSSVWSEVDEDFFNDTITFLKDTKNALDHVDWLKSLKERMIGKV